jgi:hypothetical protein
MTKRTISLRCFTLFVLVLGCAAGLILSHYVNAPNDLNQPILGPITSGMPRLTQPLTSEELASALARHKSDGSIIDQIVKLKSADITPTEKSVEPSRNVPLIGQAELHRYFFICDTVCKLRDGSEQRIKIRTEKNHFHLVENTKQ